MERKREMASQADTKFNGLLLGMALGDALGLPREGLSRTRAKKIFGNGPLHHQFFLGRGMISDDTEHACMTAQAILSSHGEPAAFATSLAWRLRWWLLGIPAGIGWATLRAILKLWCGFPPSRSGVWSAGNGPTMRAPILGAWAPASGKDASVCRTLVEVSTCITHTDPRAAEGAIVLAVLTGIAFSEGPGGLAYEHALERLLSCIAGTELQQHLKRMKPLLQRGDSVKAFAGELGLMNGVSGYVNHTVPIAVYAALRWPEDFRRAVEDAINLGGDTDTVGAIVGGIVGAALGPGGIPAEWRAGLMEWPRSSRWIHSLSRQLAQSTTQASLQRPAPLFWPGLLLRNIAFTIIVLFHGVRRLLPPY